MFVHTICPLMTAVLTSSGSSAYGISSVTTLVVNLIIPCVCRDWSDLSTMAAITGNNWPSI